MRPVRCAKVEAVLVLVLAIVAAGSPAPAAPPALLIDQQQTLIDATEFTVAVGGFSEQKIAQTFTVGLDGRFAGVNFAIGCGDGVLEVEIQGTLPTGEPDGVTLVRRSFRADSLPAVVPASFEELRLPRRLAVAPGDQLAVVLSNPTGSCGVAASPDGDSYLAGRAYFDARPNPPGWLPFFPLSPEDDLPFQTVVFARAP